MTTSVDSMVVDTTHVAWDETLGVAQPVWSGQRNEANETLAVYGPDLITVECPTGTDCTGPVSHDIHGSALTTPNTQGVVHADTYDPWGNTTSDFAAGTNYGYRSELHTGTLIHLRHRDYDPTTGTFLSPDPLDGQNGTTTLNNPYHYTNNNPPNLTDPLGLRPSDPGRAAEDMLKKLVPRTIDCRAVPQADSYQARGDYALAVARARWNCRVYILPPGPVRVSNYDDLRNHAVQTPTQQRTFDLGIVAARPADAPATDPWNLASTIYIDNRTSIPYTGMDQSLYRKSGPMGGVSSPHYSGRAAVAAGAALLAGTTVNKFVIARSTNSFDEIHLVTSTNHNAHQIDTGLRNYIGNREALVVARRSRTGECNEVTLTMIIGIFPKFDNNGWKQCQ